MGTKAATSWLSTARTVSPYRFPVPFPRTVPNELHCRLRGALLTCDYRQLKK